MNNIAGMKKWSLMPAIPILTIMYTVTAYMLMAASLIAPPENTIQYTNLHVASLCERDFEEVIIISDKFSTVSPKHIVQEAVKMLINTILTGFGRLFEHKMKIITLKQSINCLLYTSDAADE